MEKSSFVSPEMQARYLQRRKDDILALISAIDSNSLSIFKTIGHKLKGSAASYGHPELAEIAKQLEAVGETNNSADASSTLAQLQAWLQHQLTNSEK